MATVVKEREIISDAVDTSDHLTLSRWLADTLARWRLIALVIALTFAATVLAILLIPSIYRTQVSFVANTSSGSRLPTSALSGAAGPLAGLASQVLRHLVP